MYLACCAYYLAATFADALLVPCKCGGRKSYYSTANFTGGGKKQFTIYGVA